MRPAASIGDLRDITKRAIPKALFEYVSDGSYEQHTLRANKSDLDAIKLRQRVLVDVSRRLLATKFLGRAVSCPMALAPTGLCGLIYPDGEIHACRAAQGAGIPFALSTVSICSLEDVAEAVAEPFWFQLYVMQDRGFTASLIERAAAVGCDTLVMTVDLQVQGRRYSDIKNGMSVPPRLTPGNGLRTLLRPRWALGILRGKRKTFGNLADRVSGAEGIRSMAEWTARQYDPTVSWRDVEWVRSLWKGNLVLKGVLDPEDARRAGQMDIQGIIVSNHGGRQLDSARSSAAALPPIVEAVGNEIEVFVDGGVTTGIDILKYLALGARGVFIGRAYLYGLGAGGEAGARKAIDILREELSVGMALTGCTTIADIDSTILCASAENLRQPGP